MTMTNETNTTPAQLINILEGVIATLKKVDALETQVALVHSIVRAQEENNNQLAEIAFDENKFTQALMDKVDEVAREAARDCIDVEEIARDAAEHVDLHGELENYADRAGFVCEDKVNDLIHDYVNDNNLLNTDEVESVVEDYLQNNDYVQRDDVNGLVNDAVIDVLDDRVEDVVRDVVNKAVDERTENVARRIVKVELAKFMHELAHALVATNKLTAKENDHANDSRDTSIQVSGTNGQGEARSYNALGA
jgi:hypothetical protein